VLAGSDHDLRLDLALRASREVVRELRGLIRITSDPRSGAKIEIYLPGLEREASVPQGQATSVIDTTIARTVLVVEDDDAVRVPAAEFLKMEGFKVLQARTGLEAMHAVLRSHSPVDVLVTDIVMPEMGGREVAQTLLEIHPHLKVLYMSGDSDKAAWTTGPKGPDSAVLQKPFRLQLLKDKIDRLLSSESESMVQPSIE
jgi:CheY-like chemotaxis protein